MPHNVIDIINIIIDVLGVFFQGALWFIFIYYFVISIFGWFKRKEVPANQFEPVNRFAVIVAAHNEEAVIGNIIKSLKKQNYPVDLYKIFVIADNCTDKTAEIARQGGVEVCERADPTKKGKGFSMEWMFKKLFEMEEQYDAVCIFDADNLVSPDFLLEMNKQLSLGHKVIQGYLDCKNPTDSWISGNYSISYWVSNRLFQLPRHYLGLSCALGGTGFAMSTSVLKDIGWGATCLTEDLEFSLKLVLKGMRISWSHEAKIYDEKPLTLKQSWKQRKRWMQGHCDCAARYFKQLIVKAFKDRDKVAFDSAMYLLQPFIIVFNGISLVAVTIKFLVFSSLSSLVSLDSLLMALLLIVLTYYSIIFVFAEGKLSKPIVKYFIIFPLYSLTWVPIIIEGFIHRNQREWVHTLHTRALDIKDVEDLEKVG